jgi:hypothetical protein
MKRPVAPLVYAAIARPLPSITKCTGGLDPIPAAHTVDVTVSLSASSKGPPAILVVESEAENTIIVAGLGAALAADGVPVGGAGTRSA